MSECVSARKFYSIYRKAVWVTAHIVITRTLASRKNSVSSSEIKTDAQKQVISIAMQQLMWSGRSIETARFIELHFFSESNAATMDANTLNDLLECSVCLERLDTSSRVLPCQHTFCRKCLEVSDPTGIVYNSLWSNNSMLTIHKIHCTWFRLLLPVIRSCDVPSVAFWLKLKSITCHRMCCLCEFWKAWTISQSVSCHKSPPI